MKLSNEQISALQDKMAAARTSEEIVEIQKEMGNDISVEDAAQLLAAFRNAEEELTDNMLENISGGIEIDNVPQYEVIKDYYKEKGANLAFILCIFFIPSPTCYDIIKIIEEEIENESEGSK